MTIKRSILALVAMTTPIFGNNTPAEETAELTTPTLVASPEKSKFSGSFTSAYATAYAGRGLVVTRAAVQGEGAMYNVLKTRYDVNSAWSFNSTLAYNVCLSGHTLYGNPSFGFPYNQHPSYQGSIKKANVENEFVVCTEIKYTQEKYNFSFGHDFIHGGLLGVMAKHYRGHSRSAVNEFFVAPEITPYKWMSLGCHVRYSSSGVKGWWFEPALTFKAPIIGTPEEMKLAGVLSFHMSVTADYYETHHNACDNGVQAYWIKFATPWFVTPNFIITPSVSFNWLGKGANSANQHSEYSKYSADSSNVPFRDFAVIGTISCTYTF